MTDFRLHNAALLWWLAGIPLIILLFQHTVSWGQMRLTRFASTESLKALIRGVSDTAFGTRVVLLSLGAALAIFALARPQGNPFSEKRETSGLDILVLLDVSRSMDAEDVYPSRLGRAKKTVEHLMDQLSGDRIGVVAFAGSAVVAVPLTGDYETAKLFLSGIDTDLIENQGTDFAHAVKVGIETLERGGAVSANDRSRLIIVLSDGEFHLGGWENAVKEAKEKGVVFFSVALGTSRGAPIPVRDARRELVGHKRDQDGTTVITKTDEAVMKKVAADGGGVFYFSTIDGQEVNDIINRSKAFSRGATGNGVNLVYEEFFQFFLAGALLCFFLVYIPRQALKFLPLLFIFITPANADSIFYSKEKNTASRAEAALKEGKPETAVELYRELQVENPQAAELNYNLGTSLGSGPEKEEARRILLGDTLKSTPLEFQARFNAAGTFAEEKKTAEAKSAYATLISDLNELPRRTPEQNTLLIEAKKRLDFLAQENSSSDKNQQQDQKDQKNQKEENKKDKSGGESGEKKPDDKKNQEGKGAQQNTPEQEKERQKREANNRRSVSDSESEQILETLNNDESRIQKKFLKMKTDKGKVKENGKDW